MTISPNAKPVVIQIELFFLFFVAGRSANNFSAAVNVRASFAAK